MEGSLEGKDSREYDPVGIRVGAPCSGEEPATMTGIYVSDLQHQRIDYGYWRRHVVADRAVANLVEMSSMAR